MGNYLPPDPQDRVSLHEVMAPVGWWPTTVNQHDPDPIAALDAHVALVKALRGYRYQGVKSRDYQTALGDCLDRAETIVVTHQLLDFVLERLPTVPLGQPMTRNMLPFSAAFVQLPRPVYIPYDVVEEVDVQPERFVTQFDIGMWVQAATIDRTNVVHAPGDLARPPDKEGYDLYLPDARDQLEQLGHEGIAYLHGLSEPVIHEGLAYVKANYPEHANMRGYDIRAPMPIYSSGWRYGLSWDPEKREETFTLTKAGAFERRFWLALWATLMEQVEVEPAKLDRATIRRAARGRNVAELPEVVVCNLRMLKRRDRTGKERTVRPSPQWNHRWEVVGHPRTIHRGTPQERVVQVKPHVKGPEWAPLIKKDRVYRLAR